VAEEPAGEAAEAPSPPAEEAPVWRPWEAVEAAPVAGEPAEEVAELPPTPAPAEEAPAWRPWEVVEAAPVAGEPAEEVAELPPTPAPAEEAPAWRPPEAMPAPPVVAQPPATPPPAEEPSGIPLAFVPPWLRPPGAVEPEAAGEAATEITPIADDQILASIKGGLKEAWPIPALDLLTSTPPAPLPPLPPATPAESLGQVFRDVLAAPATPSARPGRPRRGRPALALSWLMTPLLLVAVCLPFFFPGVWSRASTDNVAPMTTSLYNAIQALPAGSTVLVSFDYEPGVNEEMEVAARVLIGHLMSRRVRIVALGLTPPGPALATEVFGNQVRAEQIVLPATVEGRTASSLFSGLAEVYDYVYGKDYVNLGYLPGDDAAVAALGRDLLAAFKTDFVFGRSLTSFPILETYRRVTDFALVLCLTGDEAAPRRWLTQLEAPYGVPVVVVASAAVTPQLLPYYQSRQIKGLINGVEGAAQYELLFKLPGRAVRALDAQSLAHLVIVLLILLSNVVFLVGRMRRISQKR